MPRGKIVLMMGPSCSGKDTLFKLVKNNSKIKFEDIILHTTRPMRNNEQNGREYYFCDEKEMERLESSGDIIERRSYNTNKGIWHYFTAKTQIDLDKNNYIGLNTLEGLDQYLKHYDVDDIISLYIYVEKGLRLERAINREKEQDIPNYQELCRRFLADSADFSLENLRKRPITAIIDNNGSLEESVEEIEKVLKRKIN